MGFAWLINLLQKRTTIPFNATIPFRCKGVKVELHENAINVCGAIYSGMGDKGEIISDLVIGGHVAIMLYFGENIISMPVDQIKVTK